MSNFPMISWICLFMLPTVAVGGLTMVMTMKEAGIPHVRMVLAIKVWGLCVLFAAPLGIAVSLYQ